MICERQDYPLTVDPPAGTFRRIARGTTPFRSARKFDVEGILAFAECVLPRADPDPAPTRTAVCQSAVDTISARPSRPDVEQPNLGRFALRAGYQLRATDYQPRLAIRT